MANPVNWGEIPHIKAKKYANGSNVSGPHGKKLRKSAIQGRALGTLHKVARRRPIWQLHAHPGNSFIQHGFMPE